MPRKKKKGKKKAAKKPQKMAELESGYSEDPELETTIIDEPEPVDPVQEWKDRLKAVYDDRPVFIGRQYNHVHKWYSRLEALCR